MNYQNGKILKYRVRQAGIDDIYQIMNVERLAWPDGLTANEIMFKNRINTFPEGVLVAETPEPDKMLIGVVVTEIVEYDFDNPQDRNWYQLSDNGNIIKTHNPDGNAIFGVDLSVVPAAQNKGVATKLLENIGKLIVKKNIQYALLGGRIPGYHKYAKEMNVQEYVDKHLPTGEKLDPELNFYLEAGLKMVKIVPNYFHDPESLDYGVLLKYRNPFYIKNRILGSLVGRIFGSLFSIKRQ